MSETWTGKGEAECKTGRGENYFAFMKFKIISEMSQQRDIKQAVWKLGLTAEVGAR